MSITSFVALVITSLARTSPNFQPTELVWTTFLNDSGWVDSIAFLTGLVNPNYMYAGIDGAIHLAEECKNAAVVVPRALMSTIGIGFVTSFVFAIVMVYCTNDFEAVVTTPTGTLGCDIVQTILADKSNRRSDLRNLATGDTLGCRCNGLPCLALDDGHVRTQRDTPNSISLDMVVRP